MYDFLRLKTYAIRLSVSPQEGFRCLFLGIWMGFCLRLCLCTTHMLEDGSRLARTEIR